MLFKSFFEKFQPTPKMKNNWLLPFRKSGVRVNMKSVKFDRVGGFKTKKNNNIFTESGRPSIFTNLQEIDSSVIKSTPASPRDNLIPNISKDEKLFSKIHNVRKNNINFGLIGLILLILAVSSVGLYFYTSNKLKDKQQIVEACKKYVSEQKTKGFVVDKSCDINLFWYDSIFADSKASSQFEDIKKNVNKQANDQQTLLVQLDKDIRATKQNLASLGTNFERDLQGVPNLYPTTITDKQNLLTFLKNLLIQKDKSVTTTINQFNYLIKISTEIDSQKEQNQLKNYDNLAKSEKYSQYASLSELFYTYKQKLIEKNSDDWFKKALENPELYKYKPFLGEEFKNLIDNSKFENTSLPNNDLIPVLGDDAVDKHIIEIAESRGYKKRPLAIETSLTSIGTDRLQVAAKEGYEKMIASAEEDGIRIGLVSGFRSLNDQKSLFQTRFRNESLNINKGRVYTNAEVVSGKADDAINKVLSSSSIPGYSRHHTGYTIDITDLNAKNDFTLFADTQGYKWMSANNYFNSKRFGFIPSYPPGASNQGPEPESWEYVYVGVDVLK